MQILKIDTKFRYITGVIKHLTKLRKIMLEEDMMKFEIIFDGYYYYLKYEYHD